MMLLYMSLFLISIMSLLLMKITIIFSKKMKLNMEKMSPFECGFNSMNKFRTPFSMRFFMITIMFLIFDVEITLLLPMIFTLTNSNLKVWFNTSMIFLMILIIGLLHEWNQGMLNWF